MERTDKLEVILLHQALSYSDSSGKPTNIWQRIRNRSNSCYLALQLVSTNTTNALLKYRMQILNSEWYRLLICNKSGLCRQQLISTRFSISKLVVQYFRERQSINNFTWQVLLLSASPVPVDKHIPDPRGLLYCTCLSYGFDGPVFGSR